MEICYKTLAEVLEILHIELNQKPFEILSPIGYFIASELFKEILESVNFLHKQNITHRNLNPYNIFITDGLNGRFVKISGISLSKIYDLDENSQFQSNAMRKYSAPEIVQSGIFDVKSDIYSLGVIVQDIFNIDINKY
jgi:serine/threonine protein kinase